ncbi:hypothetical protein ACFFTN_09805 [Aminobacter aganoensis]|uniref:Uncharacterized protein n=1 Tax=Aminobacter aganoensis TaxID=83264 RepID=A0A7X0KMQ3_9HYPH|nr:hypothetical protein [Aminobacter aganoensis]MBB6356323.1 hypothetical protein [Aminobacter aganoensis]
MEPFGFDRPTSLREFVEAAAEHAKIKNGIRLERTGKDWHAISSKKLMLSRNVKFNINI